MNGAVDSAAATQRLIRCVDDRIHFQPRDVTQENPNAFIQLFVNRRAIVKGAEDDGIFIIRFALQYLHYNIHFQAI